MSCRPKQSYGEINWESAELFFGLAAGWSWPGPPALPSSRTSPKSAAVARPDPASFDKALVERGRVLANYGDCTACHTRPDGPPFAGNLPLKTPFGTIYTSNITPDTETGIGTWSKEAFRRALKDGVDREGHHLYPAFPYDHFTKVKDADIDAIYAYLMAAVEPVRETTRGNDFGFPVQHPRHARGLEGAVPRQDPVPA